MIGSGWGNSGGNWFKDTKTNGWRDTKGGSKLDNIIGLGILGAIGIGGVTFLSRAVTDDSTVAAAEKNEESQTVMASIADPVVNAMVAGLELGALGGAAYLGMKIWQQSGGDPEISVLRLKPTEKMRTDNKKVAEMVKEFRTMYARRFWQKRVWIRWQIIRNMDGTFEFRVFAPSKYEGTVLKTIGEAYPDLIIQKETEYTLPSFYEPETGEIATMRINAWPWQKERGLRADVPNQMGAILNRMPHGTIVEVMFSPSSLNPIKEHAKKVVQRLEEKQKKGKDTQDLINLIRQRYVGNRTAFDVYVDVWSVSEIGSLLGKIGDMTEGYTKLRSRRIRGVLKDYRDPFGWPTGIRALFKWRENRLTDLELAPFFLFPPANHKIWEYIQTETRRPPVTWEHFNDQTGYGIGYIDSEDPEHHGRIAYLRKDTYTNHGLIAGQSGGGKGSAIMMLMRLGILEKWINQEEDAMGATICDPHTEDILLILAHLLDMEDRGVEIPWEKVKVVSFGKVGAEQYPVAANLLHVASNTSGEIDKTAADVEEMILSAFDSSSLSQSVSYLKKGVQGILHTPGEHSLLDIVRMFEYSTEGGRLREAAIQALNEKNDTVRTWWIKTHTEIMKEKKDKKVNAIDTRLAPLLDAKGMQRFFLRQGNFFRDIPKWIEEGYLVLIDFKQAPDEMFRLAAAWLARQYSEASQSRGTGGRPHILLFDEVQKFNATEVFFQILTENRKFNCGLILATQDVEALDDKLKRAIKTNAGFVLSVRQGDGADQMAKLLGDPFTPEELQNLQKGKEACIRSFDGKARLKLDYPYFPKNGKATERGSDEEKTIKKRAEAKFMELLERDHKTATEADKEIAVFVYNNADPSANQPSQFAGRNQRGQTRGTVRGQVRGQANVGKQVAEGQ